MIAISPMNEYSALFLVTAIVFGAFISEDSATISQVGFRGALLTKAYGLRGRVNLAWPSVDFFPARVYRCTSLLAFAACRFRLF